MEYHSFLCYVSGRDNATELARFPSPYGVSFILIHPGLASYNVVQYKKFPSPYGVSFILINNKLNFKRSD